ncbi:uncharacterized protein EAF01_002472 [Botrytis porri]|uniref:uncharacterized protein n=1 Tax=Botrytis porri TaxID=87229 RepID=UPI0018FF68F3|nr:uncharacterized protein EAF01_002472 [Botrytis porri]KAF7910964.1 hypothetical protein EAF01_002472 [Botrytis porri]
MKFTTTIALSGLIASSLAAPSRPNQARGHRSHTLQKSQKAGGFAQPSGGFPGGFGGFGGPQGGRARPTGTSSGFGSGSESQAAALAATKPTASGNSGAVVPPVIATPIASSAATSSTSSAAINIANSSTTSTSTSTSKAVTVHPDDEYNVSWAGAVLDDGGSTIYTGVYTEFVVPTPQKPTRGETSAEIWTVSSWVGIDGYEQSSECAGLWQAGVDASIDRSGKRTYDAWYEWYPANTLEFALRVTAGDTIAVNLTYSSFTKGNRHDGE